MSKKNNVILVLSTALINDNIDVAQRMSEYKENFEKLIEIGYGNFFIVETVQRHSVFLEYYSQNVFYTNVNGAFKNRGTNYVNAFKKFINESSFEDNDLIIHITGRYLLTNDFFIKKCESLDLEKIGVFKKDEFEQFHLFLYGLRFGKLKEILNKIDVVDMEKSMKNLERVFSELLPHEDILFTDYLGIIPKQSNQTNKKLYGKVEV